MIRQAVLFLLCVLAFVAAAQAQTVVLSGVLGSKALLVVDGAPPKSVAIGETHRGVKLLSAQGNQAEVEIGGKRQTLRLGEGPVSAAPSAPEAGDRRRIVLHAGSNGHFRTQGQINGRTVNFIVDTGASVVSMSVTDAEAIGLRYQSGQTVQVSTANGVTVGWRVKLSTVRLGSLDVYDVEALVTPAPMPYVLLGNSYLTRFQMTRTNDQLVLEQRY
ncbi:MAG: TIGR02281 family clan AA aspartic protease [Hylemonella sp.]|uniref:retropepsin-like aspartic protease family protein n=1 Tax=Hylemonella sp. TaxID=2066020 RepID=UPI0022C6EAC6|nr:TIGR02281 family clan AA aspartic protease [Hylemonella sp.]MCZ8251138.1 TIGR02281 family clan AA aspartic protease [Hylemonella sp.]